jgi:hypothetical protein
MFNFVHQIYDMGLTIFLKRKHTRLTILLLVALAIIIAFFSLRGAILRKAISVVNNRLASENYSAHWDGAKFKGITTVFVKEIFVRSKTGNNQAQIDSISIKVRIAPLILGNIRVRKIGCSSLLIRYNSNDTATVIKESVPDSLTLTDKLKGNDFASTVNANVHRFFHYVPAKWRFGIIDLRYNYKGITTRIAFRDFTLLKGKINASMIFEGNKSSEILPLTGIIDKSRSQVSMELVHSDTTLLPVPVLIDKFGIAAGFDSLAFSLNFSQSNRHLVSLKGTFSFAGLELNGTRISTEKVKINHFVSAFKFNIGSNFLELDSSTVTVLNQVRLNPYIRLSAGDHTIIALKILPASWQAQRFFNSLPDGMFTSLKGIQAEGILKYNLNFSVDIDNPDSLFFDTRLTSEGFNVIKYGIDDYRMINGSFRYQAYDKGRLMASFIVGPDNPDFVSIDQISPFLRAAVMTSEDGSFYFHNGFNSGAFRESIVTNIKEGRFARGGSTITMQLVKNVFLTRNKTLARKIEEALIVWIIETKNLVSKQRMYEVYLNVIEWGPGIYGANQASHFYFNKRPGDLSLQESVYLASIVPRPKWYKYTFEQNGIMRPFYSNYFNRMKELMVKKEFIAAADTFQVSPSVMLSGPASKAFSDTTAVKRERDFEEMEILPALNYFERKSFD